MTGKADVRSPMYGPEMHCCAQVVKMDNQGDLLIDCCMSAIDESRGVD